MSTYRSGDLFIGWKLFASLPSDSTVTGDCGKDAPRPLSLSSSFPEWDRNDGGLNTQWKAGDRAFSTAVDYAEDQL